MYRLHYPELNGSCRESIRQAMFITSSRVSLLGMTLSVISVLKEAAIRSSKRNGLMFMGIFFVLSVLSGLLGAGLVQYTANQPFVPVEAQPNAVLVLPAIVAGVLSLLIGAATLVVSIAAIRVFVSDETERVPREYVTRNIGWAALNLIVGAIIFGLAVALGFVALLIPGLFLLVTLVFWSVYVTVEDQAVIESFRSSWRLTRGSRLPLFLLGLAVVLLSAIINTVFGVGFVAGAIAGSLLVQLGSAIVTVFSTAALAAAYNALNELPDADATLSADEDMARPSDGAESI